MKLSTTLKFNFNSSIALLKLIPSDFQSKQKWFSYIYNAIFHSVIFLRFILEPSKQLILILCYLQKGSNLGDVITIDLHCSSERKVRKSCVESLPVKYLILFIKQLPLVEI